MVARAARTRRREIGFPGEPPFTRGDPSDRLSRPPLDHAHVRRLRGGGGHQRPVPPAACRRPDRAVDRLRHADPLRLRHRRPRGGGRVRHLWRGGLEPGRHGGPAVGAAARADLDVDDDQLPGRADLGDVHRGRREDGRAARTAGGNHPERHPQGVRRPEGVPLPARAVDAPGDRHDRVRYARAAALEHGLDLAATTSAKPAPRRSRSWHSRSPTAWPTSRPPWPGACGSTTSHRACRSSSTATATSSRRSPSSAPPGGSGTA